MYVCTTLQTNEKIKKIAEKNIQERKKEVGKCEAIVAEKIQEFKSVFKAREIERAMSSIPKKVKEINQKAVNEVFAKELAGLDSVSRQTLDKILAYVEKKYISVPMKMAKEILLEKMF